MAPVAVTTSADDPLGGDDVGHQGARPSPSRGLERGQRHRVVVRPRARAAARRAPGPAGAARPRAPRVLARRLLACRRATAARPGRPRPARRAAPAPAAPGWPASGPAPTTRTAPRGDRDGTATRSPRTASRAPCPVTIVCRSRLPNELCHSCRSASPRRRWPSASAGRPRPLGERRAHVAVPQPYGERGAASGPGSRARRRRASSSSPRRRTTSAVSSRMSIGPPRHLQRGQLRRRGRRPWSTSDGRGSARAAPRHRARAPRRGPAGRRPGPREAGPGRARGGQRALRVRWRSAARAIVSSASPRRCWSRWLPKVRAASSRHDERRAGQPGGHQRLGPVLVADRHADRAQRQQDRARRRPCAPSAETRSPCSRSARSRGCARPSPPRSGGRRRSSRVDGTGEVGGRAAVPLRAARWTPPRLLRALPELDRVARAARCPRRTPRGPPACHPIRRRISARWLCSDGRGLGGQSRPRPARRRTAARPLARSPCSAVDERQAGVDPGRAGRGRSQLRAPAPAAGRAVARPAPDQGLESRLVELVGGLHPPHSVLRISVAASTASQPRRAAAAVSRVEAPVISVRADRRRDPAGDQRSRERRAAPQPEAAEPASVGALAGAEVVGVDGLAHPPEDVARATAAGRPGTAASCSSPRRPARRRAPTGRCW